MGLVHINKNAGALTRPPATPSLSVFVPHRPSNTEISHIATAITTWTFLYAVTSWCHGMTSRRNTALRQTMLQFELPWCTMGNVHMAPPRVQNSHFSIWRPWPLTYDFDLRTHPRCHQWWCSYQIVGPYIKRFNCESAEFFFFFFYK